MPLPHEQAAIDRAKGRQRERLAEAAAVLDGVRAAHPGVNDLQQLPPEVRSAALQALRAFRPAGAVFGVPEVALLLMLTVGAALTWFKPVRAFRCAGQGGGVVGSADSARLCGLWPLSERALAGIARASTSHHTTTSESQEGAQTRTVTTRVSELTLLDADNR